MEQHRPVGDRSALLHCAHARAEQLVLLRFLRFVFPDLLLRLRDQRFILADLLFRHADLRLQNGDLLVDIRLLRKRGGFLRPQGFELALQLRLLLGKGVVLALERVDLLLRNGRSVLHHGKRRKICRQQGKNEQQRGERAQNSLFFHGLPPPYSIRAGTCGSPSGCRRSRSGSPPRRK